MSLNELHKNFQVHINSDYASTSLSDKTFEISQTRHNLSNNEAYVMKLIDFNMPLSIGNIHNRNNRFQVEIIDNTGPIVYNYDVIIPPGQYSASDFATTLQIELNTGFKATVVAYNTVDPFIITINEITNKITYSVQDNPGNNFSGSFEFYMFPNAYYLSDDILCGPELGFDGRNIDNHQTYNIELGTPTVGGLTSVISYYPIDLSGVKRIYLHCPTLSFFSPDTRENTSSSIIASIPNTSSGFGLISYFNSMNASNLIYNKHFSHLRFNLTDELNRDLYALGLSPASPYTFTLQFDILKIKDNDYNVVPKLKLGYPV